MNLKFLLCVCYTAFCYISFGQKISKVDISRIEKETGDAKSAFYYPSLLRKFTTDSMLSETEYQYLYYGNAFYKDYKPYGAGKNEDRFMEYYRKEKYKKALKYGQKVVDENPVNLAMCLRMAVCYKQLGDKVISDRYAAKYFKLMDVIYKSGSGNSIEDAFVVICVNDEYQVLADMDLNSMGQSLMGQTDRLTISPEGQTREPKINELYFNVSLPFSFLSRQFKEK